MEKLTPQERKTLNKMYWWSHSGPFGFNMVKMMANYFTLSMMPGLKEVYKDDPEGYSDAVSRSQSFFNTHIIPANFIVGMTYALEKEKKEKGTVDAKTIEGIKASLMGPTAGIFDSLCFNCLRIICAGIAIGFAAQGNIFGPLFFFIVYHGIQAGARYWFTFLGYQLGTSFIDKVFNSGLINALTKAASALGTVMVGAMIATSVRVPLNVIINSQGVETDLLATIDGIFPGLLGIILVFVLTKMIRKGKKPMTLIFAIIILSLVCALIGIF